MSECVPVCVCVCVWRTDRRTAWLMVLVVLLRWLRTFALDQSAELGVSRTVPSPVKTSAPSTGQSVCCQNHCHDQFRLTEKNGFLSKNEFIGSQNIALIIYDRTVAFTHLFFTCICTYISCTCSCWLCTNWIFILSLWDSDIVKYWYSKNVLFLVDINIYIWRSVA